MATKVFIDVNIMIDFFDGDRKEHDAAKQLFRLIENGKITAYISESVLNTTAYLVRKSIPIAIFKQLIKELIEFIYVLPCTNGVVKEAYEHAKNDLEDAVLYYLALAHETDYFITSNKKDFNKLATAKLPVLSSRELLKLS